MEVPPTPLRATTDRSKLQVPKPVSLVLVEVRTYRTRRTLPTVPYLLPDLKTNTRKRLVNFDSA